jgi:predicted phage terminase large subunit-like protein
MTGAHNDYSVCTSWVMDKNDFYLIDVFRGRLGYPQLRRKIIDLAARHHASQVLIENVGPGMNLVQDLGNETPPGMNRPIGVKPEGAKQDLVAQSAKIEAGHVHLPKDASWLGDFLNELLAFPNARHDDQVDSVSQFLFWAQRDRFTTDIPFVVPYVFSRPRPDY